MERMRSTAAIISRILPGSQPGMHSQTMISAALATVVCGLSVGEFYDRFLASPVPREIERANPTFIAGCSGMELAYAVVRGTGGFLPEMNSYILGAPGPEYWAGWALAYLQWYSGYRFGELRRLGIDACSVMDMYYPMHEADISKFVESALEIMASHRSESPSPLKLIRKSRRFTQKELEERSGVSLRMIQAYEQKNQDIQRAEAAAVAALSRTLGCWMEELL